MPRRSNDIRLVVSANSLWNIINFRAGLLKGLERAGFNASIAAPPQDPGEERMIRYPVLPLKLKSDGLNPIADLRLLAGFFALLRRVRPAAFLSWTAKPNIYGSLAARMLGIPAFPNVSGLGTAFLRNGWLERLLCILYKTAFQKCPVVFFQNRDDLGLFVERGLVEVAAAHPRKDLQDADQRREVDQADQDQEGARDGSAPHAGGLLQRGAVVAELGGQRADAERHQRHHDEDDRAVAEAEPEADAERPLAFAHQLAGRVVDGGDVVGIEGVPHPERVCRDAQPDPHELPADGVAVWRHEADQHAPAEGVQQQDKAPHTQQAALLVSGEGGMRLAGHAHQDRRGSNVAASHSQ